MNHTALFFIFLPVINCSTHVVEINFNEFGIYASDKVGNKPFEDVGPVAASYRSWVWASCQQVVTEAIKRLLHFAKLKGANTVYNVKFYTDDDSTSIPCCRRQWG